MGPGEPPYFDFGETDGMAPLDYRRLVDDFDRGKCPDHIEWDEEDKEAE